MYAEEWPELNYEDWKDTRDTFHRWLQIAGKVRTNVCPWVNHSWHSTLYVTSKGLTTSLIPNGQKSFSIDFDLIRHRLEVRTVEGNLRLLPLRPQTVASFYHLFCKIMTDLKIPTHFSETPNEVSDPVPFHLDTSHSSYDRSSVNLFWKTLVAAHNVLQEFRSGFLGKCSPVHFFWGSLDLAVTRFSGRRAPEHPGGALNLSDEVVREAYSHEVSSCGFWPGNSLFPQPAFYSYAYPQPPKFEETKIGVGGAFYHQALREFILPYEEVRKSSNPKETLLSFCQRTYEAAANLGGWDRIELEESPYLRALQEKQKKLRTIKPAA